MRALAAALLLVALPGAAEAPAPVWLVRIATEQAFVGAPLRRTLLAPALPVGDGSLLLAVGFALDPPDDKDEVVKVSAVDPAGRIVPAELVGGDEDLDCTLLRLKGEAAGAVALESAPREPGDEVVLVGRHGEALGYALRRATMRIEAKAAAPRTLYALPAEATAWQGAAAFTPDGRLVGFVDLKPTVTDGEGALVGLGPRSPVIVPADAYADVPRSLPRKDRPRPWIGVNLAPFDEDREAYFGLEGAWEGALVTGVAEGSPGDRAGLRLHDLVQSIGDLSLRLERMEEWGALLRSVQRLPLGKPLPCRVVRFRPLPGGGHEPVPLVVELTLEARPLDFEDAPETDLKEWGFRARPLTQDWRRSRQIPPEVEGAVVTRIEQASPADLGGLRVGDLILKVEDRPVPSPLDLERVLGEAKAAKRAKVVFFVRRGTATLFLTVQPDG